MAFPNSQSFRRLYESSTIRFIQDGKMAAEVKVMVPVGLLFLGLVIRTVLGAAIVIALVWLLFKLAKLADAYAKKLQPK
jgi:hypothetical protein